MPSDPAHADPPSEPGAPVPAPDWMTAQEWEAWCDATAADDEPPGLGQEDEDWEEPDPEAGEPGSGEPGSGPAGSGRTGSGRGGVLHDLPGGLSLAFCAEDAAGDDDRYAGASDDELDGAISAWDRIEAYAAARKHAAVAEFIRRRPEEGCELTGPGQLPERWDEFAVDELRVLLAESKVAAERLMDRARDLAGRLPGTAAAFKSGKLRQSKVTIIVDVTAPLDPEEAQAAEERVLDRAARLTPGGLRHAIAQAVMDVAPEKARKRREDAKKDARVERWAEDSGNAALMGRELPPDEVLAADQRITAWAHELREGGLAGDMDVLRARAYLDLLLGQDSRPCPAGGPAGGPARRDVTPGGFAVRGTLTVPLADLTGLADRPGEMGGIGPVDPWLARDLATAAARNPRTSWCVTVTDEQGHAVGHGCARPEPKIRGKREGAGTAGRVRDGPAGFGFTPAEGRTGPPGGYGTWRLRTPGGGPDLIVELVSITTEECDHRFQAPGHDPGVRLRHLARIRHATCTSPVCRRPASQCDFEHNVPYEAGGRTCLCNTGPKCRHDHRVKQHPRWNVEQLADGTFRWTTPSGRSYLTEPTRYPI